MEQYRITGTPPSKKNSKNIIRVWWRTLLISSKNYLEYEKQAVFELKQAKKDDRLISHCDKMEVVVYVKDKRKRDLDNILGSICDIFVKAWILEDDNYYVIPEINIKYVASENPYVDVFFT